MTINYIKNISDRIRNNSLQLSILRKKCDELYHVSEKHRRVIYNLVALYIVHRRSIDADFDKNIVYDYDDGYSLTDEGIELHLAKVNNNYIEFTELWSWEDIEKFIDTQIN